MFYHKIPNNIQENMLVFGISENGKSTFSKKKIEKYCSSGFSNDQIVVVDPHGEYREIAEQFGFRIRN